MTYDELIAKMDDIDVAISNGFGSAKVFLGCVKAVRSIIELHKPCYPETEGHMTICEGCSIMEAIEYENCQTIKAIVKELE